MCCPPELKKWHDPCFGLNERLSDPAEGVLGRFISRDPIGHTGNLNLYAYPTNPVNFVDPSGLEPLGGFIPPRYREHEPNIYSDYGFTPEDTALLWMALLKLKELDNNAKLNLSDCQNMQTHPLGMFGLAMKSIFGGGKQGTGLTVGGKGGTVLLNFDAIRAEAALTGSDPLIGTVATLANESGHCQYGDSEVESSLREMKLLDRWSAQLQKNGGSPQELHHLNIYQNRARSSYYMLKL